MRSGSESIDIGVLRRVVGSVLAAPLAATLVTLGIPALALAQSAPAAGTEAPAAAPADATDKTDADDKPEAEAAEKPAATANSTELSTVKVTADSMSSSVNPTTASSIGFAKPLLETPRSVSFLDADQLNIMGINGVQDIMRAVPGTYTTTRYGLQGGTNIRGVQADEYWRGMKRLFLQGHSRSDFNGFDSIEIIEGPPSPLFGMGSMGGYLNVYPKSARASTGSYLSDISGFAQATVGSYQKTEGQVGVGGPLDVAGKHGGFYIFSLLEDSNSFMDDVKNQQKILQSTGTLDNFIGPFRLEAGVQYQNSKTSGDYINRVTQDLVSRGMYVGGSPLVPLNTFQNPLTQTSPDPVAATLNAANQNAVSYRETHINSPLGNQYGSNQTSGTTGSYSASTGPSQGGDPSMAAGFTASCASTKTVSIQGVAPGLSGCASPYTNTQLKLLDGSQQATGSGANASSASVTNAPLVQTFQWPYNKATGQFYLPGQFPTVAGIPTSMNLYIQNMLAATKGADPTGRLTAVLNYAKANPGSYGPVPVSGWLPVGMVLDPQTTGYKSINYHGGGVLERLQNADLELFYADLIYDSDPNFTLKNQVFSDNVTAQKDSYQPYGEYLVQRALEDKITATRRIDEYLPHWLNVNTLGSLNYRITHARVISSSGSGDYDWRQDNTVNQGNNQLFINNSFTNFLDYPSYSNGNPYDTSAWSSFNSMGAGAMLDIDLFKNQIPVLKDTNVVLGYRWDGSNAQGYDYTRFNPTPSGGGNALVTSQSIANNSNYITGTGISNTTCGITQVSATPQQLAGDHCQGWSHGTSNSISISEQLPYGFRPYATASRASLTLDDSNNRLSAAVIGGPVGHIGTAQLREVGMKGSYFGDTLLWTTDYFVQSRTDVSTPSDPTAAANVTSTKTKGWENKITWAATRKLSFNAFSYYEDAHYVFNSVASITVSGRTLGFPDIRDNSGNVIYPAESFIYGGKANINIPPALASRYNKYVIYPDHTYGLSATYQLGHGFSLLGNMNWLQGLWADRIDTVYLPQATTFDASLSYDMGHFHLTMLGTNIFNKHYFQPGGGGGDTDAEIVTVMPGAQYQLKAKITF
ncbi:MAG: TonB-dependent receptor plug domain-containing protein [Nevskia sp.]|nr:TonB-dependent receptor plug domain-containing protein [Nevskia sp.]